MPNWTLMSYGENLYWGKKLSLNIHMNDIYQELILPNQCDGRWNNVAVIQKCCLNWQEAFGSDLCQPWKFIWTQIGSAKHTSTSVWNSTFSTKKQREKKTINLDFCFKILFNWSYCNRTFLYWTRIRREFERNSTENQSRIKRLFLFWIDFVDVGKV